MIMKAMNDASATQDDSSANTSTMTAPEERRGLPKVRSGINIASIYVEAKEGQIGKKEQEFKQQLPAH
jgi:hypothetical protein